MVVLRRRIKRDVALTGKRGDKGQQVLALAFDETQDDAQLWDYTVLVTDVAYDLNAIGQLYCDRCDCENGFDELKRIANIQAAIAYVRQAAEQCQSSIAGAPWWATSASESPAKACYLPRLPRFRAWGNCGF